MINKVIKINQLVKNQELYEAKQSNGSRMRLKMRKILLLVVGALFVVIIVKKVYRFVRFGAPIVLGRPQEPSINEFGKQLSFPIILNENDQACSYDFKGLLELLDECDMVKKEFYADFTPHFARKKDIDKDYVEELLKRLYRERALFGQYSWELKGYAKQGLSIKKRRSLIYYQAVIQKKIEELEHIKKMIRP